MDTTSSMLALAALVAGGSLLSFSLIQSYRRLQHVPGPFIAALTDFWAATNIWKGGYYHEFIYDLHDKYGPVVRWGPNRISFAQPAAISEIYSTKNVFSKAPSYDPMIVLANGQEVSTLVTMKDEKQVTAIKRQISDGFSQSTWLKQEDQIDGILNTFLDRLRGKIGQPISLSDWLSFWSFDTLTQVAFSDSRGFLVHGADIEGTFISSRARFAHWRTWMATPSLESLLFKNRVAQYFSKSTSALAKLAMRRIQDRKSTDTTSTGRDLLGRYLAASQNAPEWIAPREVLGLTISTIHAGAESTATTSSLALMDLLSFPEKLKRLEDEILGLDLSSPPAFKSLEALPYLDAVIRETMRLRVNSNCAERVAPSDLEICGFFVPAGTHVSIAECRTLCDTDLFGNDSRAFRPERWLNIDEAKWREMEKAAFGFGYGKRGCLGRHLAMIEMKKVIGALIQNFKISLVETPEKYYKDNNIAIKLNVKLESRI